LTRPVLTLDLATRSGWAYRSSSGAVTSGAVDFKARGKEDKDRARLRAIEAWLPLALAPLAQGRGDLVYELTGFGHHSSIRISAHLEALLLRAADAFGIPPGDTYRYSPQKGKQAATGKGNASKAEVLEAMAARWDLPELDDEDRADALALLTHHLEVEG